MKIRVDMKTLTFYLQDIQIYAHMVLMKIKVDTKTF